MASERSSTDVESNIAASAASSGRNAPAEDEAVDDELPPADTLRSLANAHFASGDYETALPVYSLALDRCREEIRERPSVRGAGSGPGSSGSGGSIGGSGSGSGPGSGAGSGNATTSDDKENALSSSQSPTETESESVMESPLVVHLCNRSACLFRMERYDEALVDAQEAVQLSHGRNAKASFRLARTQIQLRQYADAITTAEQALKILDDTVAERNENSDKMEISTEGGDENVIKTDQDIEHERRSTLEAQQRELTKLLQHAQSKKTKADQKSGTYSTTSEPSAPPKDLTTESRQPSIREFELGQELGQGNFSRVVVCQHKVTHQSFALKIIEKKKVDQLAKRQHPNVVNEVQMERRILAERLSPDIGPTNPHIVRMYHAFQDYNNLYFLQELHSTNGDLWSALRDKNKMVGTYPSLAKRYAWELVDAVEFLHSRGIVHRDLKPENCIINDRGHLIVLDFGTAKDMVWRDLNGPEFVGTADFMSPEMVRGVGDDVVAKAKAEGRKLDGVDHTADLWAMGAVIFQLLAGSTPYAAPSPYLTFLRIQRGTLLRPWGVADDAAWDLIAKLLQVNPKDRLGADAFDFCNAEEDLPEEDTKEARAKAAKAIAAKSYGKGYECIRQHPYFDSIREASAATGTSVVSEGQRPIPSLRDLALRATAELIVKDSLDFDVEDNHPPGDSSSHDMLRLNATDRKTLMHYLDKTNSLAQPRVFRRLFKKKQEAKLGRIRSETRDFVGLSRLGDGQTNFPSKEAAEDPNHPTDFTKTGPIQIVCLWNPLFVKEKNESCTEEQRKEWTAQLKDKLRLINKTRPKLVVAAGYFDTACRKLMAKINESIPVAINDGSCFYSTWTCGAQGLFLRSTELLCSADEVTKSDQMIWLKEQLEQSRLSQHHVFVFVDCDPKLIPESVMRRLARGKTLCVFGPSVESAYKSKYYYEGAKKNEEEEEEGEEKEVAGEAMGESADDSSDTSSAANDTDHTTVLAGSAESQLRLITLEEYGEWESNDI